MKKYYCPHCGYRFTKEEHKKIRKLSYPMECIKCGKDFRAFAIIDDFTKKGRG